MWWLVSWLVVFFAFVIVLTVLLPTPGEMCVLEGGRWIEIEGLTACIGRR